MTVQGVMDGYTVISMWVLLVCLLILPLFVVFKRTRKFGGVSYFVASAIFGLGLWCLSAMIVYSYWGGLAVWLGVFLFGFGVLPMALIIVVWHHLWDMGWLLISWGVPLALCRSAGVWALART